MVFALHSMVRTKKKRKVVGRGGAHGGTSGRGHKGQKARTSGTVGPLFEGGQMPLHRCLPKRGFSNVPFRKEYAIVNVNSLEKLFDSGTVITKHMLEEYGLINGKKFPLVKILGNGHEAVNKKLIVEADAYSQSALKSLKAKGGDIRIISK